MYLCGFSTLCNNKNKVQPMENDFNVFFTNKMFLTNPIVNKDVLQLCKDSWEKIATNVTVTEDGSLVSGYNLFYNDFFEKLQYLDHNNEIQTLLESHNTDYKNYLKNKLLLRIVEYIININLEKKDLDHKLFCLGTAHKNIKIKEHMYYVFIRIFIFTISEQLDNIKIKNKNKIIDAWINLFSFIINKMFPAAAPPPADSKTIDA
jgi:hypothetical protein